MVWLIIEKKQANITIIIFIYLQVNNNCGSKKFKLSIMIIIIFGNTYVIILCESFIKNMTV